MIKTFLYDFYIKYLEKNINHKNKADKIWNHIKKNSLILDYATEVYHDEFKSKTIAYYILNDRELYNTAIYNKLINLIYTNVKIARTTIGSKFNSFLLLTLNNKNLNLTKEQKIFLIFEAENQPCTKKDYDNMDKTILTNHGTGLFDIRYKILLNHNFSYREKKNLFFMFYPDEEIQISILEDLEWTIITAFDKHNKKYSDINNITIEEITTIFKNKKEQNEILKNIKLYKELLKFIPENLLNERKNFY